jgi:spore coat polysaccharide biosynthesis protein SpsF
VVQEILRFGEEDRRLHPKEVRVKIVASIQARLGSSRLPGKVLKDICGKPMLLRHVERLRRSRLVDEIVVATTTNPNDDAIAALCKKHKISVYRGSEDDVLGRVAGLVKEFKVDVHAECFGDSPLTDVHILDEAVGFFLKHAPKYDFVSNALKTTYPPGQEAVVYRGSALLEADKMTAKDDPLREHCGFNVSRRPEKFKLFNLEAPAHYRFPETYLEVDTPEDFALITAIVEHFEAKGQDYFSLAQILDFLATRKELAGSNRHVERRWKKTRKEAAHG